MSQRSYNIERSGFAKSEHQARNVPQCSLYLQCKYLYVYARYNVSLGFGSGDINVIKDSITIKFQRKTLTNKKQIILVE